MSCIPLSVTGLRSRVMNRLQYYSLGIRSKSFQGEVFHLRSSSVDRLPVTSRINQKNPGGAGIHFHDKGGTSPNTANSGGIE